MNIPEGKKVYFASDNHLGAPTRKESAIREKKFVAWLDEVKQDAAAIFLLGDLFDFWFEYKTVIPKGFSRTFGKLAEITDAGIPIYYFVGNHDLWMKALENFDYNKDFEIKGRWENSMGDIPFSYDFWYQPRHNVMVSSEWAAPNTFMPGFDLEEVGLLKYGREIHFWNFEEKRV